MHASAYRHGSPSSDLSRIPVFGIRPWAVLTWPRLRSPSVPRLPQAPFCVPPLALPAYLSPRLTNRLPDGFSTRTHSRVHSTKLASHSAGVASLPICPA